MTNFLLCGVLLACVACSAPTPENYWIYRNLSEDFRGRQLVVDAGTKTLTVSDLSVDLEIRSQSEEFICFSSEFLNFAVPRNLSKKSGPWSFGRVNYRVIAYRDELILGQYVSLFSVGARIDGNDLVFYFSKQRGLIALARSNGTGTTLFSVDYCGFGAGIDCRADAP